MEMNSADFTSHVGGEVGETSLRVASGALRGHTEDRWVEVAGDMLTRVMSVSRVSHPIRARSVSGSFYVSEQVLSASLQRALDVIPLCEVTGIQVQADADTYTGLTIRLAVQYPYPLIPIADQVRAMARQQLAEILGPVSPVVTVSTMHVHVDDVTTGDPKIG